MYIVMVLAEGVHLIDIAAVQQQSEATTFSATSNPHPLNQEENNDFAPQS
jgi:hypothetical protein